MQFVQNVPFFSIMLCMVSGIFSAMLPGRAAKWVTAGLAAVVAALNLWLTIFMWGYGESYVYWMGHFPAPWGNELRAGVLESTLAVVFSLIMLLSVLGGMRKLTEQVDHKKVNIVCVMLDLVLAAMMSMLYTNDLFTAYVFIEIMTLTACALIMSRQNGRTMVSAMRYMIMSLLGSGLTLIAITITYNLTGHLLMENIHDSLVELSASGEYATPITVIMGLFFVGLGIKSALYPFHTWLPDAYGYSTPTASAVLSSIVSKAYIFLLIKIFYRVIGMGLVTSSHVMDLMFVFGIVGMIIGSINAIFSHDLRRMVAFSSVAQIGYIYAGLGLGTGMGFVAAIYHISCTPAPRVRCSSLLRTGRRIGQQQAVLRPQGAGFRNPAAGRMLQRGGHEPGGHPGAGRLSSASCTQQRRARPGRLHMWVMLIALAVSTLLNVLYFMKTVITLYRPPRDGFQAPAPERSPLSSGAMWGFVALNQ